MIFPAEVKNPLEGESNIEGLELMIRVIRPHIMDFLHEPTPHLTKSLVYFQIQSFAFLFEESAFGVPKALKLAKAGRVLSCSQLVEVAMVLVIQ